MILHRGTLPINRSAMRPFMDGNGRIARLKQFQPRQPAGIWLPVSAKDFYRAVVIEEPRFIVLFDGDLRPWLRSGMRDVIAAQLFSHGGTEARRLLLRRNLAQRR